MNKIARWLVWTSLWLCAAAAQAGTHHYYYTDPQGTVLAKADTNGTILATYDYAPYGTAVASMSPAPNGPGYTGHVNDPDTGLVYMQARYYQPDERFLSPDPVGPAPGNLFSFNRYAYANNNPVANIDPTGRETGIAFHAEWAADGGYVVPTSPNDKLATPLMYAMGGLGAVTVGGEVVGVIRAAVAINKVLSNSPAPTPATASPKPAENFVTPTNPAQEPPTSLPNGHTVRVMPKATEQYPNGYWRQYDSNGNPVNPSTGRQPGSVSRAESRAQTHVPLPSPKPATPPPPPVPPISQ